MIKVNDSMTIRVQWTHNCIHEESVGDVYSAIRLN